MVNVENDTFAEFNSFERGEEPVAADDDEFSLSDDFFNYPIICTTFVSLFNSVIKNNKKSHEKCGFFMVKKML